jgi:hypothetical protein
MTKTLSLLVFTLAAALLASCNKSGAPEAESGADASTRGLECDHDLKANAVLKSTWPFPADYRDLQWVGGSQRIRLRLKPNHAAFVTATVSWPADSMLEVRDSQVRIIKPRRLVAKRDLFVTRKEIEQGVEVNRTYPAAKKGEVGSFLFYNSRGMCLIGFEKGAGWTSCTLDDAFEGLSAEDPHPCEQEWWVELKRSKVDKGWTLVYPDLMERVPPTPAEAR